MRQEMEDHSAVDLLLANSGKCEDAVKIKKTQVAIRSP